MLTTEQRDQAVEGLEAALAEAQDHPGADDHKHILLALDLDEAQGLIDTLNYPFPSTDVLLPYAERQSEREQTIADAVRNVPAGVPRVIVKTDDIRYLIERNNFLRDTLASVGEEVGELSRRVDALTEDQTPSEALAKGLEAEMAGDEINALSGGKFYWEAQVDQQDEAQALKVFEDTFRGGRANGVPAEETLNLIVGGPNVTILPAAARRVSDRALALVAHHMLELVRGYGDAVKPSTLSVVDGELTLDVRVEH